MAGFDEGKVSTEDIGEDFGTGDLKGPLSAAVADEDADADGHEASKKVEKKVHIAQVDDIQSHRDSLDSKDEALKKELKDFSSQNPEIAAQLIRTWLRGEDNHNG